MWTKTFSIFGLLSILFITSCKVAYLNTYYTSLQNNPAESLSFKDSLIKVTFETKPNGITFNIENLTKNNLYLIWDKSYFIEPSGSSSKLLNTDILETASAIRNKENYESVIPQYGHFFRFTCSSINISSFSRYNTTTFYNEVTKTIDSNTDYSEFYTTKNYWYLGQEREYSTKKEIHLLDKSEAEKVKKFILNNNNLSLGFTLRNKNQEIEYHFKFPINRAIISKKTPSDYLFVPCYELNKLNDFNFAEIKSKSN